MKVDLVYLWVDGQDPEWAKKRFQHHYKADNDIEINEAVTAARTLDNDELRYSLRSVEKYAPWINHIFIVTDNQTPKWLDTNNPKVSIIDHKDIMPHDALPCYNSCALELAICNIPHLCEHFIYANDDMMLGRSLSKDFFFNSDGKVKCRFFWCEKIIVDKSKQYSYNYSTAKASERIADDFSREDVLHLRPHHQIDAYKKSVIKECLKAYPQWHTSTIHNCFRSYDDMQRHILSLYCIATNQGEIIILENNSTFIKRIPSRIKAILGISKGIDSKITPTHTSLIKVLFYMKILKPALVCFNGSIRKGAELKNKLNKIFPKKSKFEL
ncbi:MAG: stealth family protein [Rikenellaceae bacterium]